jgi:Flp pilus assembly protein TadD
MGSRRMMFVLATMVPLLYCVESGSAMFRSLITGLGPTASASASRVVDDPTGCRKCHADAVDGFSHSKMAHSMRVGDGEPVGTVRTPGATITMSSDAKGSWQTLESGGTSTEYHVDYVIGSGTHAAGYIMDLGDHLFQSPVAFYRRRGAYGLAPGYEAGADPDYTRPIADGCVFCHAGSFNAIQGSVNQYGIPPFSHLTIGCDRCHGSSAAHLRNPRSDNIVSPARLEQRARDSVCEQCHLIGAARVLNPGKQFTDFQAGQPLENTFTIYHAVVSEGTEAEFKVISHSEQLALSKCKLGSSGKMWCGTCHDPHNEPVEPVAYYREKCLLCHANTNLGANHPPKTSNCIGCHMPQRATDDGGHTAFTDHRIQLRPEKGVAVQDSSIAAWREPFGTLAIRNMGIASIEVGAKRHSPKQIISGYRMLTEVQQDYSHDGDMYSSLGTALYLGKKYDEAVRAFELAVRYDPGSSAKEMNLGEAYRASGNLELAQCHLEKAIEIDQLNLGAATALIDLYTETGQASKANDVSHRISALIQSRMERK